jgi:polysaccharide pyruvyl transferase WcaK-like protein
LSSKRKKIHIGHHFFGSGNLGDDFLLTGFLKCIPINQLELTCCVPYNTENLKKKFPSIIWLPYTKQSRFNAIKTCDSWLGLGGSPFQTTGSQWFIDHLKDEAIMCKNLDKPMYFLGIGAQDESGLKNEDLAHIIKQSKMLWLRDEIACKYMTNNGLSDKKAKLSADLSHIYFSSNTNKNPTKNCLSAILNFDYENWHNLVPTFDKLLHVFPRKNHWIIQETRPLPYAERDLYSQLPDNIKSNWEISDPSVSSSSIDDIVNNWPIDEWVISSRFHAAILSAWSGSKTLIIESNLKLKAIAKECGFSSVTKDATPNCITSALQNSRPAERNVLQERALLASSSVNEWLTYIL